MKPILFNTEMVRAILDGRKTVTRRVVKPQHLRVLESPYHKEHPEMPDGVLLDKLCRPPYLSGGILYVRETWAEVETVYGVPYYVYKASDQNGLHSSRQNFYRWYPSIHMPKEAARLFLRVTGVRVERLQDISEEDAISEGIEKRSVPVINASGVLEYRIPGTNSVCISGRGAFSNLWNSTIKMDKLPVHGWDANPWVWVIEFKRCERPKEEG